MIRRVVVIAVLAALLIVATAVRTWQVHVAAVATELAMQTRAAQALVGGQTNPRIVAQALLRPLIHIVIEDRANGELYDARADRIDTHPLPPNPGPPAGLGPPPRSALNQIAAQLARIRPQRVDAPPLVIHLTPDAEALAAWLVRDALLTVLGLVTTGVVATWMVLTISRVARARLEAVVEERRTAAAEFQRFLADAGHELRTPLTIVSGYVDILSSRADETDPQLKRMFDGMRAETARMRALVEKMLLLARLETPVAVPRLVDIASVAHDAATSMRAKYAGRSIEFHDGERAPVVIDQDDLYEALHNLIENALKYAPESNVEIETGVRDGRAFARIVDYGPGIAPAEQQAVFRRFYRGNGRSDSEGSGLGLAIVARVVDRWAGTIDLASSAHETRFTITFPLADEEPHVVAR